MKVKGEETRQMKKKEKAMNNVNAALQSDQATFQNFLLQRPALNFINSNRELHAQLQHLLLRQYLHHSNSYNNKCNQY
jgi:phage-related protein